MAPHGRPHRGAAKAAPTPLRAYDPLPPLLTARRAGMILAALIAGDLLLALLCIGNHFLGYPFWPVTRLLYLSGESNIPTWFTSLQLAGGPLEEVQPAGKRPMEGRVFLQGARGWGK